MKTAPEQPEQSQQGILRKDFRRRFLLLKLFFAAFFLLVAGRLVTIQVVEAGKYQALARKQYEQKFTLPATRGIIADRNGNVLVSNTILMSFAADPKIVGDNADEVALAFARTFGKPKSYYYDRLQEPKRFVWLERRVRPELARRIESAKLNGIVMMNEPKRLYHYDDLAGTLLGFTNVDNKGISGIELELDSLIRGVDGMVVMQRDGLGRVRPSVDYPRREPINGSDVTLTLDLTYQAIVEEELKKGIAANKADAGLAVMLRPATGEVLAMSVSPGINPNESASDDIALARNRVVSDMFEPGSIFKVVTASAAYQSNLVRPESRYYADHGTMRIPLGGRKVRLIKDSHEYDWLSFQEAIEFSSNIVMAKVSKLIGPERLYTQARSFGFGTPTGISIPGEVRGVLKRPSEWSGTTLQTMAYGYEVGVTPLQVACAYAAVANHGVLMKPFVVAEVRDSHGEVVYRATPQTIRKVIPEETARLLTAAFEGAVERGTAMDARVQGVRIAGKTGTSRKIVGGKYSTSSYTASFVGYFPVEEPQAVCLVMLDNPRSRSYYGGQTSGPVFRAIAERVIQTSARFSRTPVTLIQGGGIVVPDVRALRPALAQKILKSHGLGSQVFGRGEIVLKQSPEPGKKIEKGDVVTLIRNDADAVASDGTVRVPDVRGLSIRRAMNRLTAEEFDVKVEGTGVVARQVPSPGERVRVGSTIMIVCEPRSQMRAALY